MLDLGLSKKEIDEAVNLEKLYSLAAKTKSCQTCGSSPVTHVDTGACLLVCRRCGAGRGKKIGEDRIKAKDIAALEKKLGRRREPESSDSEESSTTHSETPKMKKKKLSANSRYSKISTSIFLYSIPTKAINISQKVTNQHGGSF